ncbi:hypothetical protein PI124_g11589 [Phytophthora idaei]|nr:hypothetical protein PI125_g8025 [Phytophthora idaei]KAG3127238.1 hypothetical protein PI126_g21951 [Phytophthora idaei]KAG3243577.1 hypothetical protein PI124_g11589 [Phytophthora idaei]
MAHLLPSTGSPPLGNRLERPVTTLTSGTVVFSHTRAPSCQLSVVAGIASPYSSQQDEPYSARARHSTAACRRVWPRTSSAASRRRADIRLSCSRWGHAQEYIIGKDHMEGVHCKQSGCTI